jgi:transposase-like protein
MADNKRSRTPSPEPAEVSAALEEFVRASPDERLAELVEARGVEEGARAYVEEVRWPGGPRCLRCSSERTGWLDVRRKHYCRDCGYQFRVTVGTVFHDSHVSLPRWLVAIQLMIESERGHPATKLWAAIGGSYKTAWFVNHRIRAAMSETLIDLGIPVAFAADAEQPDQWADSSGLWKTGGEVVKRWRVLRKLVAGTYHCPSPEHLTAYWNEARWRAANADNSDAFRETVHALLDTRPLPYRELTARGRRGAGVGAAPVAS